MSHKRFLLLPLLAFGLFLLAAEESPSEKLRSLSKDKAALAREYSRIKQTPTIDPVPVQERVACFFCASDALLNLENQQDFERDYRDLLQKLSQARIDREREIAAGVHPDDRKLIDVELPRLRFLLRFNWIKKQVALYDRNPEVGNRIKKNKDSPELKALGREIRDIIFDTECSDADRLFLAIPFDGQIRGVDGVKQLKDYLDNSRWSADARIKLICVIAAGMTAHEVRQTREALELVQSELARGEKNHFSGPQMYQLLVAQMNVIEEMSDPDTSAGIRSHWEQRLENSYQQEVICDRILQLEGLTDEQRIRTRLRQAKVCAVYNPERACELFLPVLELPNLPYYFDTGSSILYYLKKENQRRQYFHLARVLCEKYSTAKDDVFKWKDTVEDLSCMLGKEQRQSELDALLQQARNIVPPKELEDFDEKCRKHYQYGVDNPSELIDKHQLEAGQAFRRRHPEAYTNAPEATP